MQLSKHFFLHPNLVHKLFAHPSVKITVNTSCAVRDRLAEWENRSMRILKQEHWAYSQLWQNYLNITTLTYLYAGAGARTSLRNDGITMSQLKNTGYSPYFTSRGSTASACCPANINAHFNRQIWYLFGQFKHIIVS